MAWDYVPDWQPPPKGKLLERVNGRVGKEVAHLSYKRNTIAEDAKNWPFLAIRAELERVLRAFVERAEDHQLDASFRQRVDRAFSAPPPESHIRTVTIDTGSTTHMDDAFNAAGTATTMLPPPSQGD